MTKNGCNIFLWHEPWFVEHRKWHIGSTIKSFLFRKYPVSRGREKTSSSAKEHSNHIYVDCRHQTDVITIFCNNKCLKTPSTACVSKIKTPLQKWCQVWTDTYFPHSQNTPKYVLDVLFKMFLAAVYKKCIPRVGTFE